MGEWYVLVVSVEPGGDLMIERKGIPCEPPAGTERRRDPLERVASVGLRRQVQKRPERAVDQRRRLVEHELAHVAFP